MMSQSDVEKSKTKSKTKYKIKTKSKTKTKVKTPTAESKTKTKVKTPTAKSKTKTKVKTPTAESKTKTALLSAIEEKTESSQPVTSIKIKSRCQELYDSIKDNIDNLNISDKDYQNILKCVEKDNKSMFSDSENEDIDSLYPHLDDSDFNIKLSMKKEFDEVKIKEKKREQIENIEREANSFCSPSIDFELEPYQMFVRNFLSFETPYNSLLVYHGLGTGKTCSSIQVCEETRSYYKQLGINKKILIVASPSVQANYKLQLFDPRKLKKVNKMWNIKACTGNRFIQEINPVNMKGLTRDKIIKQIKKIIKQSYEFLGYIEFANKINTFVRKAKLLESDSEKEKKRKMRIINKEFSDRLLVIDEVHNIRAKDISKRTTKNLLDLVTYSRNMKILLLTATPMFNDAREIIWITNLMNLNDKRFPIKISDVFDKNGNFIVDEEGGDIGKDLLIQKLTGYVSYVSGENPFTFPFRIFPYESNNRKSIKKLYETQEWQYPSSQINGLDITDEMKIKYIDIVIEDLHPEQEKGYNYVISRAKQEKPILNEKRNGIQYTVIDGPLQCLNMFYPHDDLSGDNIPDADSPIETYLYGKNGLSRIMSIEEKKKNYEYSADMNIISKYGRIFSSIGDDASPLRKYSSKIYSIIKKIQSSEGIVLIYSNYIDGGCVPIALALEEIGIKRYGNKQKSLFKTPPVENMLINGQQAKYVMITGDKDLSPNNTKEIEACTDEKNINGEKVKVIIISRAGSEGLDFQNIRQVHILDPWFNLMRIDQIIGRAVRNKSHCALPFEKRNVQIFLYGSTLSDKTIEPIDLYVYRLAEYKSIRIGKVSRILKQNAVDCLLNKNQQNLNESYMQKNVKLVLSDQSQITFNLGHKNTSILCDFMECNYTCNVSKEFEKIKFDTYNEKYLLMNIEKIIQRIRQLYNEHYIYEKQDLIKRINAIKNYSVEQINSALNILITDKSQYIVDMLGRQGNLINIGNYYLFQPIELEDLNLTLYQRRAPLYYKPSSVTLLLPKQIPKIYETKDDDFSVLKMLETGYLQLDSLIKVKQKKKWILSAPWAIENLVKFNNLDRNVLKKYCLEHEVDTLNINEKLFLLNEFQNRNETFDREFLAVLDNILNKFKIFENDEIGFCCADYNKVASRFPFTIIKLVGDKWIMGKGSKVSPGMLRSMIQKFKYNIDVFGNTIGFITKFKKNLVFKTKKIDSTESKRVLKGQACPSAGETRNVTLSRINKIIKYLVPDKTKYIMDSRKKDIVKIYEFAGNDIKQIINKRKVVNRQNVALISPTQLCIETELILRYLNENRVMGKRWFFSTIEDTINNISEIKK